MTTMVVDPPARADLLCALDTCTAAKGKRGRVKPKEYRIKDGTIDPFCSTKCCREYHGTEISTGTGWVGPNDGKVGRTKGYVDEEAA